MGTRSGIAKVQADGTIKSVYCHWDGYLEHVGVLLVESYYGDTLDTLLAHGGISSLGESIGYKHPFTNPYPWGSPEYRAFDATVRGMTTFYARDRDEDIQWHITHSERDYLRMKSQYGADFLYLHKDGKWYVECHGTFVDLEVELHANKIKFSKRIAADPIESTTTQPNTELVVA